MARFYFPCRACLARPRHLFSMLMLFAVSGLGTASSEPVTVVKVSPVRVAIFEELLVRPLKPTPPIICGKRRYFHSYS